MLVTFESSHAEQVARLHCEVLTGLIARLGPDAARLIYQGYAASESCVGTASVDDSGSGLVRGFVLGSDRPSTLRKEGFAHRRVRLLARIALGAVRDSGLLRDLWDAVCGPRDTSTAFDTEEPELIYLAVRPEARGAGDGGKLLEAFNAAMRERSVKHYGLSVDADNVGAQKFYEKHGFQQVTTYSQFGVRHCRLRLEL